MSSVPCRSKPLRATLSLGSVSTVLAFFGYSLALFVLAVVCAGAGDGTYVPFDVFSSPLALVSSKAIKGSVNEIVMFCLRQGAR
jgi:hypothetical protein